MTVQTLDHVNIRSPEPRRTIAFFRDALGMDVRPSPGQTEVGEGGWVYDARGAAVLHIGSADSKYPGDEEMPFVKAYGGGAIDHVALRCADVAAFRARLEANGVAYRENHVERMNLHQLFVVEPAGIKLELNFPGE